MLSNSGRPTPTRIRGKSSPVVAMIERSPLCPPWPPLRRMRSFPNGRSISSLTTSTPSGGTRYQDEISRTGVPERFMNVVGLTKTIPRLESSVCIAASFRFHPVTPHRRATSSTTMKPTLWRVAAYSVPGLPRPTTSLRLGLPAAAKGSARLSRLGRCGLGPDDLRLRDLLGRARCRLFQLARRARRLDRNDDRFGRREQFESGRERDVGGGHVFVHAERRHVDLEMLGNSVCRAFDFELVHDNVHHGAGTANALCHTGRYDRQAGIDGL